MVGQVMQNQFKRASRARRRAAITRFLADGGREVWGGGGGGDHLPRGGRPPRAGGGATRPPARTEGHRQEEGPPKGLRQGEGQQGGQPQPQPQAGAVPATMLFLFSALLCGMLSFPPAWWTIITHDNLSFAIFNRKCPNSANELSSITTYYFR